MAGFDELAKNMNRYGETILKNINTKTRKTALAIDTLLVKAMPVDTGRARSAVIVTVGETSYIETLEAYVPGKKGSTEGENTRAALAQAELALEHREFGEEIHININIPYIDALNKGHSPQAAAGFIEQAIQEGAATEPGVSVLSRNR